MVKIKKKLNIFAQISQDEHQVKTEPQASWVLG